VIADLSPVLRHLVKETVALFGEVLRQKVGTRSFQRIENLRQTMESLRGRNGLGEFKTLQRTYQQLTKLSSQEQLETAQAFALMLEIMNTCENAYRSQRIREKALKGNLQSCDRPDSVTYVLTAHPTEARSPQNILIFHEVLRVLTSVLLRPNTNLQERDQRTLTHLFAIAWDTSMVRNHKPQVRDEAEHIFTTLLRDEALRPLLRARRELAPIFVRSWVGGDKDGHPGVDERVFLESLQISRHKILIFVRKRLRSVLDILEGTHYPELKKQVQIFQKLLSSIEKVKPGDGQLIVKIEKSLQTLTSLYLSTIGSLHPELDEICQLRSMFPALVVPLEFRESSDVLMSSPSGHGLAIDRMLKVLQKISRGGEPRWYVGEFIISMTDCIDHLRAAAHLVKKNLGALSLPIVPLFEQAHAQDNAVAIIQEMLKDRVFRHALKKYWGGYLEIMLGYSDSSKESGVLPSRLKVAETMYALEAFCRRKKVTAQFFQGSGGSSDRGGGTIEEQTSWWSTSALRNYKVTIQGEMVERSLANSEITWGQLKKITYYAGQWRRTQNRKLVKIKSVDDFAEKVASCYQMQLVSSNFLEVVEKATPYNFLSLIKIGSRPTKRSKTVSVSGLRAIPWIMCWTQTRILFPVWWGLGSAWEESTQKQRRALQRACKTHPVFATYIKVLGFTLMKIEIAVWRMYLEESPLSAEEKTTAWNEFSAEHEKTLRCAHALLGKKGFLSWRPWLEESIRLRSPMIHPLNLLQILAMKSKNADLLRVTVVGISSGMMTTG
jgi:phosphoenolpyruvate carboxylase